MKENIWFYLCVSVCVRERETERQFGGLLAKLLG